MSSTPNRRSHSGKTSRAAAEPSKSESESESNSDSVSGSRPEVGGSAGEMTDSQLMERLREGDEGAANELHARYAHRIRALAEKRTHPMVRPVVETQDIVQSAFGSFFRRARQGDYRIPEGGELWHLLVGITKHKISRAHSRHAAARRDRRRTRPLESAEGVTREDGVSLVRMMLEEALGELNDRDRSILELRLASYNAREIVELTDIPMRTVERVLSQTRDNLRTRLLG